MNAHIPMGHEGPIIRGPALQSRPERSALCRSISANGKPLKQFCGRIILRTGTALTHFFPQFIDGGRYTTSLVLLNSSGLPRGPLRFWACMMSLFRQSDRGDGKSHLPIFDPAGRRVPVAGRRISGRNQRMMGTVDSRCRDLKGRWLGSVGL